MAQTATQAKTADRKPTEAVKQTAKVVEQHSKKIAHSAKELEHSSGRIEDSADRTTRLAADRTILAAERTYAAWVRTGLAALASGIGARALLDKVVPNGLIGATGSVLILFSGFCFVAAVWRQMIKVRPPRPDTPRIPAALLIAVNGFLLIVSLAALVGIWLP
jgi:putative membrane protein